MCAAVFVQGASGQGHSTLSSTTSNINTTTGNALLYTCSTYTDACFFSSCSDNDGGAAPTAATGPQGSGTFNEGRWFYKINITAKSGFNASNNTDRAGGTSAVSVTECSGVLTSGALDIATSAATTTVTSATLAQSNEFAFGSGTNTATGSSTPTITGGNGWTTDQTVSDSGGTDCTIVTGYQITSSTSALTFTASAQPRTAIITLKATADATAAPVLPAQHIWIG